ncbi:cytochrome c [Aquincola sp. S2]|uniref:Cytochrome c n=1 Tax=Pseudaquabacterium terrae TaxID=2732868 RepID=A0ABX2EPP0_9BURK|nr:cytochrome c [Aquabacterium terrae]NRF70583.1 cytochrome c [Aquabacterium terrae]
MRKLLLATALPLALVATVLAAGAELSADAMRDAEDTLRSLDSNVSLKHPKALAEAEELRGFFRQVEGHYAARGDAARGVELARASQQHASAVAGAVRAGDFDAAQDALDQLTRSCKACHEVYKNKSPLAQKTSQLEFGRWMRVIDQRSVSVQRHIAAQHAAAAQADARVLEDLYARMERYFVHEYPAADAQQVSHAGRVQAASIPALLAAQDYVGAARAARSIAQACNDCHDPHKPFR